MAKKEINIRILAHEASRLKDLENGEKAEQRTALVLRYLEIGVIDFISQKIDRWELDEKTIGNFKGILKTIYWFFYYNQDAEIEDSLQKLDAILECYITLEERILLTKDSTQNQIRQKIHIIRDIISVVNLIAIREEGFTPKTKGIIDKFSQKIQRAFKLHFSRLDADLDKEEDQLYYISAKIEIVNYVFDFLKKRVNENDLLYSYPQELDTLLNRKNIFTFLIENFLDITQRLKLIKQINSNHLAILVNNFKEILLKYIELFFELFNVTSDLYFLDEYSEDEEEVKALRDLRTKYKKNSQHWHKREVCLDHFINTLKLTFIVFTLDEALPSNKIDLSRSEYIFNQLLEILELSTFENNTNTDDDIIIYWTELSKLRNLKIYFENTEGLLSEIYSNFKFTDTKGFTRSATYRKLEQIYTLMNNGIHYYNKLKGKPKNKKKNRKK